MLIATHIDADHVHSHFLVNAVCYLTGKMLRQEPNTPKRLRKLSDEICERHHLSVLPPQQKTASAGMTGREYRSAAKGQSWKFRLMNTVDQCMRYARTRDEFIALMRSDGYDVRWQDSRKNITYTTPDGLKCRDDRLHQSKYLKEAMENMNSESGQNLSLEELKQRNQPTAPAAPPKTQPAPEEWPPLLRRLDAIGSRLYHPTKKEERKWQHGCGSTTSAGPSTRRVSSRSRSATG